MKEELLASRVEIKKIYDDISEQQAVIELKNVDLNESRNKI